MRFPACALGAQAGRFRVYWTVTFRVKGRETWVWLP